MTTEQELKSRLATGDHKAFETIFKEYHPQLLRYSMSILRNEEEAKETAQRTLIKLWEKKETATDIDSLKSYLLRSAHNLCMNKFEHSKVKEQFASEEGYRMQLEFATQFENTFDPDLSDQIKEAAQTLPRKNKEVFTLRYLRGYDTEEVSKELGITPRTVETHISNAFKLLREKLKPILTLTILLILAFKGN